MAQSSSCVEVDVVNSAVDRRGTDIRKTEDAKERTLGKLTVRINRCIVSICMLTKSTVHVPHCHS